MSSRTHTTTEALLEHAQWAHALARRLVGDAANADDIVQEAYAAALQNPPHEPQGLKPWFARVLTNTARMQHRSRLRRDARERLATPAPSLPAADELAIRAEGQRALVEAVLQLEEPYRSTILLRYFEDLPAAEIARRQGIPAATIRWRLQEGLSKLRTGLDDCHAGDTRSWCTLLLPLVSVRAPGVPLIPLTQSLLSLVVTMKILKTAAVLGTVSASLFFLATLGLLPGFGTGDETIDLPPEQIAFRPIEQPPTNRAGTTETAGTPRQVIPETSQPARGAFATLRARFTNTSGAAIEGVEFGPRSEEAATSGTDGIVQFTLNAKRHYRGDDEITFVARHRAHANHRLELRVEENDTLDLGTIQLQSGGSIHGRVLDANGRPMAGIKVFVEADPIIESFGNLQSHSPGPIGRAEDRTDEHGVFRLLGVRTGLRTVEATNNAHMKTRSGAVEVRQGQESVGVELVLTDPTPPAQRLTGVVIDPDGKPIPHTSVTYRYSMFFGMATGSGSVHTGDEGRFRINARNKGATYRLTAGPLSDTVGTGVVEEAHPGHEYTIQLTRPEYFSLTILDALGKPLPVVTVNIAPIALHASENQWFPDHKTRSGTLSARIPRARFQITAAAFGHEKKKFGPFDPADIEASRRISCALATAPILRGTATANGQALADATIDLHHRCDQITEHNGFPVWMKPASFANTRTDQQGRWAITPRTDKPFFLRVSAKGWATHETEELPATRLKNTTPLDIELDGGGSLHGQVVGPQVAGVIVAISRGDGAARTLRSSSDGQFKFDKLTPGRYAVQRVDQEIRSGSSSTQTRWGTAYRETPWVCEVQTGATTRYKLGELAQIPCKLTGRLRLGEAKLRTWTATLTPSNGVSKLVPQVQVQADGSFQLSAEKPGPHRLLIQNGEQSRHRGLIAMLNLREGSNQFSLAIETGAITVSGIPKAAILLLLWEGEQDTVLAIRVPASESGTCTLEDVPVGQVRIAGFVDASTDKLRARADDPRQWPVLSRAEVRSARTTRVRLDR